MYGLRSSDGQMHGLGVFNPPSQPNYQDPGYPPDPGIVAANNALSNAYDLAMAGAQAQNNLDQCRANAENANSPEQKAAVLASCGQVYADAGAYAAQTAASPVTWYAGGGTAAPFTGAVKPVTITPITQARGGQLTFTSSRGAGFLQVGDTWLISITNASPNSPVTVSGLAKGVPFSNTPMGTTDSNGNWSKAGAAGTGEIGAWLEQWYVGGVYSGAVSFSIAAAPVAGGPTGGGAPAGGDTTKGGAAKDGGTATGGETKGGETGGAVVGGFDLSKIPVWGWAIAAGMALFAFGGGRGR